MVSASPAVSLPSNRATDTQDVSLAQRATAAIRTATVWPIAGLAIEAEQGIVTLRGRTRSFYEKQIVIHAARNVPGVRQIVDELDVRLGGS